MNIVEYLLECTVCLGVFYLLYRGVLQNQYSFRYNRVFLLLTPLLSVLLPLINIPLSGNPVLPPLSGGYLIAEPVGAPVVSTSANTGSQWPGEFLLIVVYGLGVLVTGSYYVGLLRAITRIIREGKSLPSESPSYRLILTNGKLPTSSFLNYLLWDDTQQLSAEEEQQIRAHEESHIRQKHSYDVLYLSLLKTVLWFHPFIYLFNRALVENHEYSADAEALHRPGSKRPTYLRLLARHTVYSTESRLVNHFYKSSTLKRIKMMENYHKTSWYRLFLAVPVFAVLFLFFSCQPDADELERDSIQQDHLQAELDYEEIRKLQSDLVAKYFDEHLNDKSNDDLFYQEAEAFKEVANPTELRRFNELSELATDAWKRKATADADNVFMVVEDQPSPEGGMTKFYEYVSSTLKYPEQARRMGIEGKVFVQFVVDKDGSLTDVKAIKGIGAGCDAEAERVLKQSPPWNPGQQRGKMVKVRMVLPITFRLGNGATSEGTSLSFDTPRGDQGQMKVKNFKVDGNTIEGTLEDQDGNPLAGANILVQGTTVGTVSDLEGKFVLSHDEMDENGVIVSFVGYPSMTLRPTELDHTKSN